MAGCLAGHGIPAAVGVHGVLSDVADVLFIESHHLGRQRVHRQPVDALVREKAPAIPREWEQDGNEQQDSDLSESHTCGVRRIAEFVYWEELLLCFVDIYSNKIKMAS